MVNGSQQSSPGQSNGQSNSHCRPRPVRASGGAVSPKGLTLKGLLSNEPTTPCRMNTFTPTAGRKPFNLDMFCGSTDLILGADDRNPLRPMLSTTSACSRSTQVSKKAPGSNTHIVLLPVDLTPMASRAQSRAGPRLEQRAASSPGLARSEVSLAQEQSMFRSAPVSRQRCVPGSQGSETPPSERHGGTYRSDTPPSVDGEVAASTRFGVSIRGKVSVHSTQDSLGDFGQEESCDSVSPGMTLKDYFDATDRERKRAFASPNYSPPQSSHPSRPGTGVIGRSRAPSSLEGDLEEMSCDLPSTKEEKEAAAEAKREAIREGLARAAGGALEAFRSINLSGSKTITLTDFNDGLQRLGINWQEITGFGKFQDVFKLFDRTSKHSLVLEDLFPESHFHLRESHRMSTPEFWNHWCRKTTESSKSAENEQESVRRSPKWIGSSEDELGAMCRSADQRQEIDEEHRRMAGMLRRLKHQGKSDARCREIVATHLPKGTGPKSREGVLSFSDAEVRMCRHSYSNQNLAAVRNIQKCVYEMREQRHVLSQSRHKLWTVTMEPALRAKKKDDDRSPRAWETDPGMF